MEHTITLLDCPPAIVYGSDGAVLNPFEGPAIEPWGVPQFPMSWPEGYSTQGVECKSSACPHRQACYQALSEWYLRRGQYQRPDVTVYDRLDIAQRFHAPDRPWGEVIGMAREYDLSRPTIYDIAERVTILFEPRLPGPVPCLKRLLPCGTTSSPPAAEAKTLSREEEERIRNRLILTSVFPGGVTMRPLEEILAEAPLDGRSDTTIWRVAPVLNRQVQGQRRRSQSPSDSG